MTKKITTEKELKTMFFTFMTGVFIMSVVLLFAYGFLIMILYILVGFIIALSIAYSLLKQNKIIKNNTTNKDF